MNTLQQIIAKSRYSRFLDHEERREHWFETVNRYFDFMAEHLKARHNYDIPYPLRDTLQKSVTNLENVPSMRAVMTAGEALDRQNVAGYNCAYLVVDDVKAFDEAMYILLCGTGVGFSVESRYVSQLPELPSQLFKSETCIVVKDSKEGWAKAFRQVLALLYAGEIPQWDMSRIRPAGARLKTFGGRASGPGPLEDLFRYAVALFQKAAGRKLLPLEAHDLLCKVGDVVVVGGVRRSALISLSDLSDMHMAHAKAGAWYEQNGQRGLANNSAVYDYRPDVGTFMREWTNIYESHSGERGIFNRKASRDHVKRMGRRDHNKEWGCNPCSEIILRPNQFCNLSSVIVRASDSLDDIAAKVRNASILGTWQSTLCNFPYLRKVWTTNTEEERLLGVSLTGLMDNALLNNPDDPLLPVRLEYLKQVAIDANAEMAAAIGITASVAVTAIKPEGTVSQLAGTSSGMHPHHSAFYIRRIQQDNKDPMTTFLKQQGVPWEVYEAKAATTTVFSFPMRAPEGGMTRHDFDAIQHLKLWLMYQRHYCEHKPSVTISVAEADWPKVGAWVWENFDEVTGVAFLPMDGGTYKQAPYEDIDEETYNRMLAAMPAGVDWNAFVETSDNVEGVQQLACVSGVCEI